MPVTMTEHIAMYFLDIKKSSKKEITNVIASHEKITNVIA